MSDAYLPYVEYSPSADGLAVLSTELGLRGITSSVFFAFYDSVVTDKGLRPLAILENIEL